MSRAKPWFGVRESTRFCPQQNLPAEVPRALARVHACVRVRRVFCGPPAGAESRYAPTL